MNRKTLIISLSIAAVILLIATIILYILYINKVKKDPVDIPDQKITYLVSTGNFEIDLFRQSFLDSTKSNTVISPFSVKLAMSMATEGANGYTLEQLQDILQVTVGSKDVFKGLMDDLNTSEDITLNIANSVWSRQGYQFKQTYIDILTNYYLAEARELDFSEPSSKDVINAWVDRKTEGKISKIVDSIDKTHIMFLINAIYFNSDWKEQFKEEFTQIRPFTLVDGTQVNIDTMHMSSELEYFENNDFQAVELPYGKEGRFVMRVYLPREEKEIKDFVSELRNDDLNNWKGKFSSKSVNLGLPKFKIEYDTSLKNTLQKLGIKDAFLPGIADFGEMVPVSSKEVYIGDIKHKTYIDVSERGTEAAAVTSIEMEITAMPTQEKIYEMVVDRPFFFTIEDTENDLYLFMGTILNPVGNM